MARNLVKQLFFGEINKSMKWFCLYQILKRKSVQNNCKSVELFNIALLTNIDKFLQVSRHPMKHFRLDSLISGKDLSLFILFIKFWAETLIIKHISLKGKYSELKHVILSFHVLSVSLSLIWQFSSRRTLYHIVCMKMKT